MTDNILRIHFSDFKRTIHIIKSGLTREQALDWVTDPETSSMTCSLEKNKAYTEEHGTWFDVIEDDTNFQNLMVDHGLPIPELPDDWFERDMSLKTSKNFNGMTATELAEAIGDYIKDYKKSLNPEQRKVFASLKEQVKRARPPTRGQISMSKWHKEISTMEKINI